MSMSPCEVPKDYIEYFSFERMTSQIVRHRGARIVPLRTINELIIVTELWRCGGCKTHSNKMCDMRREHISPWQVSHHHRSTSTDTLFSVTLCHDVQLHLAVSQQAKARVIS